MKIIDLIDKYLSNEAMSATQHSRMKAKNRKKIIKKQVASAVKKKKMK